MERSFHLKGVTVDRRQFNSSSLALLALVAATHQQAWALSLGELTNAEATQGLKAALEKGAIAAIQGLGRPDGFLGNEKVRIPLPGYLEDGAKILRAMGQGKRVDELVVAMNRAAESAVPLAKDMLVGAVKSMTVADARQILTGGETSVTEFFAGKTRAPLGTKFLPVVTRATEKVGLAQKYNRVAGKAAGLGLVRKEDATIEQYVTGKSLDGLYFMIGEEERKIRRNPAGAGSAILQKVFGALR